MCEPEVLPRELQNHLRQLGMLQRTTQAGLWIPQYLHACSTKPPFSYSYLLEQNHNIKNVLLMFFFPDKWAEILF
jgi:hypothetical protein